MQQIYAVSAIATAQLDLNEASVKDPSQIARIGVVNGSREHDLALEIFPLAADRTRIRTFTTLAEVLEAAEAGTAGVWAVIIDAADLGLAERFAQLGNPLTDVSFAFAVRKDSALELWLPVFNEVMTKLKAGREIVYLCYFGHVESDIWYPALLIAHSKHRHSFQTPRQVPSKESKSASGLSHTSSWKEGQWTLCFPSVPMHPE